MDASIEIWPQSSNASDRTTIAVRQQVAAMGSELFEVGLFKPDAGPTESVMIPRVWDAETSRQVRSVVAPSEL